MKYIVNPDTSGGFNRFFKERLYLFILTIFSICGASAQDFTLTVATTDEICPGNGTLTLGTENANPNETIIYKVYLLPNTQNPIFNSSSTLVLGLDAGTYLVTATQTVNDVVFTDEQEVTINDATVPLTYTVDHIDALCGPDGSITVTVTGGNAVTFELTGPMPRAPQASNVFEDIPAGTYVVKVSDNCGTVIPLTHTVFAAGPVLNLTDAIFTDQVLTDCNTITVSNSLASVNNVPISYPLDVTITLYPPGGGTPVIYTQNITTGDGSTINITQLIPLYYDQDFQYKIVVVDPCGEVYTKTTTMRALFTVSAEVADAGCGGKFLKLTLDKYMPPYTVTFTQWPAGSSPEDFNIDHPGPFSAPVTSYGAFGIPIPFGNYQFTVTEACGRTYTSEVITVEYILPTVQSSAVNNDCVTGLGVAMISIPGFEIVSAIITSGPVGYPVPQNVSAFIDAEGELTLIGLPGGDYIIDLVDNCGLQYDDEPFTVPEYNPTQLTITARPGCAPGFASLKVSTGLPLLTMEISASPSAFSDSNPLPYNVTNLIMGDGALYMNNLPPGAYTFKGSNSCSTLLQGTRQVTGYTTTVNELTMTRGCGSFNFTFSHVSNGVAFDSFWFQKEISPGVWGHPDTEVVYTEGTLPVGGTGPNANAIEVFPDVLLSNNQYLGNFRILKRFQAFESGLAGNADCLEVIQEFPFDDQLVILDVVNLTCTGLTSDIRVDAIGAEPIMYEIIKKDGLDFYVNNGTNNIFEDLQSGVYEIRVTDPCGHVEPETFNIADLPAAVIAYDPPDLVECDVDNDGTDLFNLSAQNNAVLNGQDDELFIITYHLSQEDAEAGTNPLPAEYTSGPAAIYVRVLYSKNALCYDTSSFNVSLLATPALVVPTNVTVCEGSTSLLDAGGGYAGYLWSSGETTRTIAVGQPGVYTVTVTGSNGCTTEASIIVEPSAKPAIQTITTTDWTESDNTITIITEQSTVSDNFEYSIDGTNYQPQNVFTGLAAGDYTVYIRDTKGCGIAEEEVYLLNYPKFFTPNGDTYNETWRIKFSFTEPNMIIHIYDRYGKVVSSFGPNSPGWDGTFNGHRLPSTDYWFVVYREDGMVHKGHFAMMR